MPCFKRYMSKQQELRSPFSDFTSGNLPGLLRQEDQRRGAVTQATQRYLHKQFFGREQENQIMMTILVVRPNLREPVPISQLEGWLN